jgi:hypothetical protein
MTVMIAPIAMEGGCASPFAKAGAPWAADVVAKVIE